MQPKWLCKRGTGLYRRTFRLEKPVEGAWIVVDGMGVLVWEESLGWGNNPRQMSDGEYFRLQVEQTREMVRASFNHPSVIIFAFQNENQSQTKAGKKLNDALIEAIRSQDSGRLVTFACNHNDNDISNANTDLVSFNTYPGWIGSDAGEQ